MSPGTIVRRYGTGIDLMGNGIALSGTGYYKVDISVTLAATAIGLVGFELLKDGLPVVGATAVETATGGGDTINLSTSAIVRNVCCAAPSVLTVTLTDGAANINNI
ncbi:MAG: hypothetical protein MJ137_04895 [Clostridia bacterium]|nr:hypothetical protein [Clostridia bacterium]